MATTVGQVRNEHLTKKDIEKLLNSLSKADIKFTRESGTPDQMSEDIYSHPKGKEVFDTLARNKVGSKVLRKHGFAVAEMMSGRFLDRLINTTKTAQLGKAALVQDSIAPEDCLHISIESDGVDEPDVNFYATHWCGDCGRVFEKDWNGDLVATDETVEVR